MLGLWCAQGHHNNRYESPSRFGGGAPSYHYHSQSVDHSSSPTAWQGGARGTSNGRPQPSGRDQLVVSAGIAGPTGGLRSRTSSAGSRGGASGQLASPTGVPGSAPGVSRSSNSPFAGRIVAPNGQPRKVLFSVYAEGAQRVLETIATCTVHKWQAVQQRNLAIQIWISIVHSPLIDPRVVVQETRICMMIARGFIMLRYALYLCGYFVFCGQIHGLWVGQHVCLNLSASIVHFAEYCCEFVCVALMFSQYMRVQTRRTKLLYFESNLNSDSG